jgi:hypothetical protein
MSPDRIAQIAKAFPWLPADYLRILPRIHPASPRRRYGLEWLDGPQVPGIVFGPAVGAQFPSAVWIARRDGHAIGYAGMDAGAPRLQEWRGSQQQIERTFDDIPALLLAPVVENDCDRRPVVPLAIRVPGLAFGPWHDAGSEQTAQCILLPGEEAGVLEALAAALGSRWDLTLTREDNDSWLSIRPVAGGYETCVARHGSAGAEERVTADQARAGLLALAPFNDGSWGGYVARLSVVP